MANNQLKEELILSTQHFDKKIDDVIKRVNTLKKQGDKVGDGFNGSMGKMIEKATGFNGSMGSLIGVVGKFSGALGLAVSAGEIFNRMLDQSQNLGDAVARVQNQASEAVNYFASSLASADFGNFLDGLRNIITLAGDAADAMDRAASIATRFGWTNQAQMAKYNKAMAEARNPENSKEERKKYLGEAKQISQEIARTEALKSSQDIKAAFTTIRTELAKVKYNGKSVDVSKLSDKQIRDLFDPKYFTYYEGVHNQMQQAKDGLVLTNTKYGPHGSHLAKADMERFSKSNYLLAAYAANEINDKSDSPLGQALQMIGAADQLLANQAERSAQIGRLGQKIEKSSETIKKNSGGGGKGGNTKTGIEYAVNSVGYLENKIRELQQEIRLQVDPTEIRKIQQEITKTKSQLSELMQPTKKLTEKEITDTFQGTRITNVVADSLADLQEFLDREPLQISFESDKKKVLAETVDLLDSMASSFSRLGDSFEMPELDVAGTIAQAIASVISGYAQATAQAAELGPWAWVGFALAGLAELGSVIASIHNLSGYANGGVIGGNSYSGDNLLARVNSGEMILNSREQSNLFHLLDSGATGGVGGGNVHFVIRGSELHGVLANYNSRNSKLK